MGELKALAETWWYIMDLKAVPVMSITILYVSIAHRGIIFSLEGHIFRFHDRGSWYRRTDIDKSGFSRFSGRICSYWSHAGETFEGRDESKEHRFGGKKGRWDRFSSVS
jgi:hypothetical protein